MTEGHNANASDDRLRLLIELIERLEEEKKEAENLRAALAARGLEVRKIGEGHP